MGFTCGQKMPTKMISAEAEIDISERNIYDISPNLLSLLLKDKTTRANIRWACDEYKRYGKAYGAEQEILPEQITGRHTKVIQPRIAKSKSQQRDRTKGLAEVFTPSWICNEMINACDEEWFGVKNVFNFERDKLWEANPVSILFTNEKKRTWQDYVSAKRLEITCGEAPFLVSRYDATTGEKLSVQNRIGVLDRKLRVVNENTTNETDWYKWVKRAFESTYGYEYQGDSLLLARENLLWTFIEYYKSRFHKNPRIGQLFEIGNIIAWNIWQMDGLNNITPFATEDAPQPDLFNPTVTKVPVSSKIMDWRANQSFFFNKKGEHHMKFDVIIGNPPYQEEIENRGEQPPVYHLFYDAAMNVSKKVLFITPARFLFDVGKTPSEWNHKMLNDNHFSVLKYFANSRDVFPPSIDIKGGVAITYRNSEKHNAPVKVFIPIEEVNSIVSKVVPKTNLSLSHILYSNTSYKYADIFFSDYPMLRDRVSGGSTRYLSSSVFDKFPEVFFKVKPNDGEQYAEIIGRQNNKRISYYFKTRYLNSPENFNYYKIFIPSSNGSGALGEVLSTPLMGEPLMGHTETFISFGKFENIKDAQNLNKYVKTKFARVMLGSKKVTQGNKTPKTWSNVPLQDFTDKSDIDWSKPIPQIDQQLYAKYGLDENEINFIETHVKPME